MNTRRIERDLYLAQRTLADARTAQRGVGPLTKRLAKRKLHRSIWAILHRAGL